MKKKGRIRWAARILATMLTMVFAVSMPTLKTHAEGNNGNELQHVSITVTNKEAGYNSMVQPLTTMFDCEIILAFTTNGLEMTFSTACADIASVIGVKDIKVQQKMWYGWKTVFTSLGAENLNENVFATEVTYPDAVNGKTYRVICTHYADYDVYEEVVNDTGAFKFVL